MDHDGFADILVGSPDFDGVSDKLGAVYLILGGALSGTTNLTNADAKWIGANGGNQAGSVLACQGKSNAQDEVEDLLVGVPDTDAAYLIFGLGL